MERIKIAPRPGYMGELEKIGFVFHKEYWLENAYYRFSAKEVEELEQAMEVFCCAIKLAAAEKLLNA